MKEFLTALVVAVVPSVAALEQIDQEYGGNSVPGPSDIQGTTT